MQLKEAVETRENHFLITKRIGYTHDTDAETKEHEVCKNLLKAVPKNHDTDGECEYVRAAGVVSDEPRIEVRLKVYSLPPPLPEQKFKKGEYGRVDDEVCRIKDASWCNNSGRWNYIVDGSDNNEWESAGTVIEPWLPKQGEWCLDVNGQKVLAAIDPCPDDGMTYCVPKGASSIDDTIGWRATHTLRPAGFEGEDNGV